MRIKVISRPDTKHYGEGKEQFSASGLEGFDLSSSHSTAESAVGDLLFTAHNLGKFSLPNTFGKTDRLRAISEIGKAALAGQIPTVEIIIEE